MRLNINQYIKPLYLGLLGSISLWLMVSTPLHLIPLSSTLLLIFIFYLYQYKYKYQTFITYLWEMCSALIGLFVGMYIDLGITDISVLYWLCGQSNMLSIAPSAIIGMFIGCSHGIIISTESKVTLTGLIHCNLGMLLGMLAFGLISHNMTLISGPINIIGHLFLMIFIGHWFYSFSESPYYKSVRFKLISYLGAH